ncbi:hypothetical protein TNCT_8261 [Trichonephila clavata]|uniref:Uncharacterized protein n=1 Tax=Trichonephila clavata TaxID=2740835 RepID=A0A8X6IL82_TRICU|nr:hypothetical protein TNCT_8261 [Trichonephila clavata]
MLTFVNVPNRVSKDGLQILLVDSCAVENFDFQVETRIFQLILGVLKGHFTARATPSSLSRPATDNAPSVVLFEMYFLDIVSTTRSRCFGHKWLIPNLRITNFVNRSLDLYLLQDLPVKAVAQVFYEVRGICPNQFPLHASIEVLQKFFESKSVFSLFLIYLEKLAKSFAVAVAVPPPTTFRTTFSPAFFANCIVHASVNNSSYMGKSESISHSCINKPKGLQERSSSAPLILSWLKKSWVLFS